MKYHHPLRGGVGGSNPHLVPFFRLLCSGVADPAQKVPQCSTEEAAVKQSYVLFSGTLSSLRSAACTASVRPLLECFFFSSRAVRGREKP